MSDPNSYEAEPEWCPIRQHYCRCSPRCSDGSWCCQKCGENIGWIGRFLFPFLHRCHATKGENLTLHEKLLELANRLSDAGQKDDAAIVFSAAFQCAPGPTPEIDTLTQPIPGLYHHLRVYR